MPIAKVVAREPIELDRRILKRLKDETAAAHRRVDTLIDLPRLGSDRYRRVIGGMCEAHRVVERELAPHGDTLARVGYDARARLQLTWLETDLAALGIRISHDFEPGAYRLGDAAAAFGAVYVTEGATLGGQIIARHVMPRLSLSASNGCRYFTGYGTTTGEHWRATGLALARYASLGGDDLSHRIVAGALDTFGLFESALQAHDVT